MKNHGTAADNCNLNPQESGSGEVDEMVSGEVGNGTDSVDSTKHNPPRCETCRYFSAENDGECRRYPPLVVDVETVAVFPDVDSDDWCGEHAPVHHDQVRK